MVEVFKTNVYNAERAAEIIQKLLQYFPHCRINFDLQDCDKVLRIEGGSVCCETIIAIMKDSGYQCQVLE